MSSTAALANKVSTVCRRAKQHELDAGLEHDDGGGPGARSQRVRAGRAEPRRTHGEQPKQPGAGAQRERRGPAAEVTVVPPLQRTATLETTCNSKEVNQLSVS